MDVRAKSLAVFQAYEEKPALNGHNSSNRTFGAQAVPVRGKYMKTNASSMVGSWINERERKPFFDETISVFTVGQQAISKDDALKIS